MQKNEIQNNAIDFMEGDPRSEAGYKAAIEARLASPIEDLKNTQTINEGVMQTGEEIEILPENNS